MKASRLFGDRPATAISVVEPSVSRWYAQRARLVFYVVSIVAGAASTGLLSVTRPVAAAVFVGALIGLAVGFTAAVLVRVWPVLRVLWWWALEIALAGLLGGAVLWLSSVLSLLWAVILLAVLVVSLCLVRPVRRGAVAWTWCAIVRHRLRHCFAGFLKVQKGSGPTVLPLILFARPTPAGERVWIWLRPGMDLAALDGKTGAMAVVCWSSEVRVIRASESFAALIRVDVTRREALRDLVISPLLERFGLSGKLPIPVSPGVPPMGLDLDEVPEVFEEKRSGRR